MTNHILIVDDSEDTRELFTATLEAEGFPVVAAKDASEGLEILRTRDDIGLMLLDINMPGMNGMEMLEKMQKEKIGTDVSVMLVSAHKNVASLPVPENVVDTLRKPFFYPELIFKIKHRTSLSPWPQP